MTKEAKTQLEELGEETDDLITTQSKLRDLILNATKVESNAFKGFDILNDDGSYKSTYEKLLGIAEIWDEIGKRDKATGNLNQNLLLEAVAGKRRANIAASIFQNPELLKSVLASSQEAEGSAQAELDKFLDSVEGKMQQFQNSAQQLAVDLIDNETVKDFVDFGRQAIEIIDGIAKHIPLITTAIGGLLTVITSKTGAQIFTFGKKDDGSFGMTGNIIESLKTRGVQWTGSNAKVFQAFDQYAEKNNIIKTNEAFAQFAKMQKEMNDLDSNAGFNLGDAMMDTVDSILNASDALKDAEFSMDGFNREAVRSGHIVGSLKNTFANLGSSILSGLASFGMSTLVTFAIQGIGQLIDYLWETSEEIKEAGKAAQDEFNKIQDSIDSTKESAESLGEAYNRLSKGVDTRTNKNISLSSEEYQEYLDTVNQIVELSPSFKDGIDSQGNAIVTFSENVGDATAALDEFLKREERIAAVEKSEQAYDIIRGEMETQKEYEAQIGEINRQIGSSNTGEANKNSIDMLEGIIRDYFESDGAMFEVSAEQIEELGSSWYRYKTELQKLFEEYNLGMNLDYDNSNGFSMTSWASNKDIDVDSFIYDFRNATNKITDDVQSESARASDQINDTIDKAKLSWEASIDAAMSIIDSDYTFSEFSDEMQTAVSESLRNTFNYEKLKNDLGDSFRDKELQNYITSEYLDPLAHAFKDAYKTLNPETYGTVQDLLEQLFTIDSSEITASDYADRVNDIVNQLNTYGYFTDIGTTDYDFKVKYNLMPEIVVDGYSEPFNSYSEAIDALLKKRNISNTNGLMKYVDSMPIQQQVEIYEKVSNNKFTNAEIATAIVGAVEESLTNVTDYLGSYTTRKAKETAEAFTNAIAAVTNEIGNVSSGTIDEDFARFVGGYEDDIATSMINIEENAQRAQKYFTEDGLGIYSFAADAIESLDAVAEHEKLLTEGWNTDSDAHAERLFKTLEDTGLVGEEGITIDGKSQSLDEIVDRAIESYQRYIQVLEEAKEEGYEVAYGEQGQSIFGNVDLSKEDRVIEWTKKNVQTYKKALFSWRKDIKDYTEADKTTVMGMSDGFGKDNIEIAYTPVLYEDGETKLLTKAEVNEYIDGIVNDLEREGKSVDLKNVLALDYKNLVADVGKTAQETARQMHYAGANGAVELARKQLIGIGNAIDEGYGEAFLNLMSETDESIIKIEKHGKVSFKKTERGVKKLADRMDLSEEAVGVLLDSIVDLGNINYDSAYFNAMQNDINNTTSDINTLSAALEEMGSQGYLSAQTMEGLLAANPEYSRLLIHSAGGTLLDPNDVRHQVERDTVERINDINRLGMDYANQLAENRKTQQEIAASAGMSLEDLLSDASNMEEFKDAFDLEAENQQLNNYIQGLAFLRQELFGSISLMKEYKDALQTPNISDNYNTIVSGLEGANKLAEQGWWGKDDFVTYANMLAGYNETETEAVDNYIANRDRLKKYMTEDTSGLFEFANDAFNKGLIGRMVDKETGEEIANSFDFNSIDDIRKFAEGMNMQIETASNFLLAIRDAGGDINLEGLLSTVSSNLSDSLNEFKNDKITVEEFAKDFTELNNAMQIFADNGVTPSQEALQATNDAVMELSNEVPEFAAEMVQSGTQIGESAYEYNGFVYQLNEVGNVVSSFSTNMLNAARSASGLNDVLAHTSPDSEEAEAAISTYVATLNTLSAQERIQLGIEINESEKDPKNRIAEIKQQVQAQVNDSGKVEIPADIDLSQFTEEPVDMTVAISQSSIDGIRDAITQALSGVPVEGNLDRGKMQQQLNNNPLQANVIANAPNTPAPVMNASATLDDSNVTAKVESINNLSASPKVGLNTREFSSVLSMVNSSLNSLSRTTATPRALLDTSGFASSLSSVISSLNSLNGKESKVYIKTIKQTGKDTNGDGKIDEYGVATGTFLPQAGAYVGGTDVGVKKNERALVNEVGTESIVRDGKWSLIPGGAHFENLKRGDINYSVRT